jgi:hypothetical protein
MAALRTVGSILNKRYAHTTGANKNIFRARNFTIKRSTSAKKRTKREGGRLCLKNRQSIFLPRYD